MTPPMYFSILSKCILPPSPSPILGTRKWLIGKWGMTRQNLLCPCWSPIHLTWSQLFSYLVRCSVRPGCCLEVPGHPPSLPVSWGGLELAWPPHVVWLLLSLQLQPAASGQACCPDLSCQANNGLWSWSPWPRSPQTPEGPFCCAPELPAPVRPSVCRPHFLTGEFQTHSLRQHYLLYLPPPLVLAHQLCQPGSAMIPQPGGCWDLNKYPRASCGRWLIKMSDGAGRMWQARSQMQS